MVKNVDVNEDSGILLPDNDIWLPDKELCKAGDELRAKNEWMRKDTGVYGARPSQIGIESYRWGEPLHPNFYSGRTPPPVALESAENLEWYEEQLKRCVYGYEYEGQRITGDHYWMLNFTPFLVALKDKNGKVTSDFDVQFPYYSQMHDYIFKLIEQAHYEKKHFLWMSGRGSGKEQPHYEHIITPDGITTMGEIKVGDLVIGSNGAPIKVLAKHPQGVKDVYQITTSDGRTVDCGIDHLWEVSTPKHKKKVVRLGDILDSYKYDNGRIKYYLDIIPITEFNKQDTPIDPYLLGALLGDGGLTQGIRISSVDQPILDEIQALLPPELTLTHLKGCDYAIYSSGRGEANSIRRSIKRLGLNVNSHLKFIPKEYLFNSKEVRVALLQGLMDTDGSISSEGYMEFYSVSKELIDDVTFLARSLGMKANMRDKKGMYNGKPHMSYRVSIFTNTILFRLPRKKDLQVDSKYRKALRSRAGIVSIERLPLSYESSCISVDAEDNLYLTRDFIPTHNTYVSLSVGVKIYHLKPSSHGIISASNSGHANEAFDKFLGMVNSVAEVHPTLALNRLIDTKSAIMSGQEVIRDGVKYKEGPRSKVNKVIYGDNPGITRGGRPDYQLFEEIGDWSSGKGSLKKCIGATMGSWRVGSIRKVRAFFIGTGGSVTSDQAKDIFNEPDSYDILSVNDFKPKTAFFLPSHYLYGGCGWEETSVNDDDRAKKLLEEDRARKKADMEIYSLAVQEFPFTIEEVFSKLGSNIFNQKKIALQNTALMYEKKNLLPKRGFLEWTKSKSNVITGVKWSENPEGDIEIVEPPYRGPSGNLSYPNLYMAGIDGIDQGQLDSTSLRGRSSLAVLIKKRIVDGQYYQQTSNLYVAKYVGRSLDVRWDYENALKLVMFYNAKVNLEYTRIGIVAYFKEQKQYHRFIKRPTIAMPSGGDGIARIVGLDRSTLIGTSVAPNVIDHQDGKIKEYVDDYYEQIFFPDLLEQLRDYRRDDRRKYDLVVAMGLCELADEDYLGMMATPEEKVATDFKAFGYYVDKQTGKKRHGILPDKNAENEATAVERDNSEASWIDMSGKLRFDDDFNAGVSKGVFEDSG